jgi:hypothetical protein
MQKNTAMGSETATLFKILLWLRLQVFSVHSATCKNNTIRVFHMDNTENMDCAVIECVTNFHSPKSHDVLVCVKSRSLLQISQHHQSINTKIHVMLGNRMKLLMWENLDHISGDEYKKTDILTHLEFGLLENWCISNSLEEHHHWT